jgi:hypothetical protein
MPWYFVRKNIYVQWEKEWKESREGGNLRTIDNALPAKYCVVNSTEIAAFSRLFPFLLPLDVDILADKGFLSGPVLLTTHYLPSTPDGSTGLYRGIELTCSRSYELDPQDVFQSFSVTADASAIVLEVKCLRKRRQPAVSSELTCSRSYELDTAGCRRLRRHFTSRTMADASAVTQQARHAIKRVTDFPSQLPPQLPQIGAVPQDVFQSRLIACRACWEALGKRGEVR